MARFAGDEKLGKEATSAFFDVMTVLNKAYDDGSLNSILESKTTYLSALVEAQKLASSNSKKRDFANRAEQVYQELLAKRNKYGRGSGCRADGYFRLCQRPVYPGGV